MHLWVVEHTGGMTAIASAFTSEGFVVGADGRQVGRDKKIFTESSQKIFNFKSRQVDVAYAWCGETSVIKQSNEVIYDLYEITRVALTSAVQVLRTQFPLFIQQCRDGIYNGARPLHRRRPRRDDCGSREVFRCRGIRIWERSVKAVGGIVGRSFRCHVR